MLAALLGGAVAKIATELGVTATPPDHAIADTLDAYRRTAPPTSTTKTARQRS